MVVETIIRVCHLSNVRTYAYDRLVHLEFLQVDKMAVHCHVDRKKK